MYPGSLITNLTAASRLGTTVTGGTAHTEDGTWVELITAAANVALSEGYWLNVHGVSVGATDTGMLMDVSYADDAGGTNRVVIDNDINVSEAGLVTGGGAARLGKVMLRASRIPSGKSVQVRVRSAIASDTCIVAIALMQTVQHLENVGSVTAYGANLASTRGTSVTPGSGAFGSWTTVGTTGATHNIFDVGYDSLGDTTIVEADVLVEIGYGATPTLIGFKHFRQTTGEDIVSGFPGGFMYASVGSGVDLKARIASAETEARGIIIYGATGTVVGGSAGSIFRGGGPRVVRV